MRLLKWVIIAFYTLGSLFCQAQNESTSNSLDYRSPNISNSVQVKLISVQAFSNSVYVSTKSIVNKPKENLVAVNSKGESAKSISEIPQKNNVSSAHEEKKVVLANQPVKDTIQKAVTELGVNSYPRYYALLIGNSEYKFSNESLPNLANPTKDAEKFYRVLLKYSFAEKNIRLLKNASQSDIIDVLEELATKLTEKDNLLIFYAGHGYWDENLRVGYWLPSDAVPGKKATWVSNSNLKDYIAGIKSKHTLLVSDACFSGSIFRARAVSEPLSDIGVAKLYRYPSRKAMTSGNLNTTPDDSKFFEYLNKRLTENNHQFISAKEIFYSMFNAVVNNTNSIPQYGVIQETGDEGGDFIFIKKE